ncbi:MAG: hypothetical protein QM817_37575 [Archangium sp.]
MKPSKFVVALGVVGLAGAGLSGAACWRLIGAGSFDQHPLCEGPHFSLTHALLPTFEYAELRDTSGEERVLESAGAKCASAKDVAACNEKLTDAKSTEGWNNGSHGRMPGHHYIVATRGDEVMVVTQNNLAELLKPVDTATKAALIAAIQRGIFPSCEKSVRQKDGKYELHLVSTSCFGPTDEVVSVDSAGTLNVLESSSGPATCVGSRPIIRNEIASRE